MPTGKPDFGASTSSSPASPITDDSEVANRLLFGFGANSSSGRWLWASGLENGVGEIELLYSGAALDTLTPYMGKNCIKLEPPLATTIVSSLLHFNGADGSTTFTDETGKIWTASSGAQIDTAQSKFGGASGLFNGTGAFISTPDSIDFTVGSGDFTFDLWIRRSALGRMILAGQLLANGSNAFMLEFDANNKLHMIMSYNSGALSVSDTYPTSITDTSSWHHVAGIRSGNTLYTSVDGVLSPGTSVTGITQDDETSTFSIGRGGEFNSLYFSGWIDEFRFSKGIARWTSNFTPPASEYAIDTAPGKSVAFKGLFSPAVVGALNNRFGSEVMVALQPVISGRSRFYWKAYAPHLDNVDFISFEVYLDIISNTNADLYYLNNSGTYTKFGSVDKNLSITSPSLYHYSKLVYDINTNQYVRFIFDTLTFDLSGIPAQISPSVSAPFIGTHWSYENQSTTIAVLPAKIDNLIITRDEP